MNLTGAFDRHPPFVVYALARKSGKRIALESLVKSSGLSRRTFVRIGARLSWEGITLQQIDAFCTACRVDLLAMAEQDAYLRRTLKSERPLCHLSPRQLRAFNLRSAKWIMSRQ